MIPIDAELDVAKNLWEKTKEKNPAQRVEAAVLNYSLPPKRKNTGFYCPIGRYHHRNMDRYGWICRSYYTFNR
jgi:hypothetical protein